MNETEPIVAETSESKAVETAGRDALGRFTPGGRPGPGRPRGSTRKDLLAAVDAALAEPGTWAAIVQKAVSQALKGDPSARIWLSKCALGSAELIDELRRKEAARMEGASIRIRTITIELPGGGVERTSLAPAVEEEPAGLLPDGQVVEGEGEVETVAQGQDASERRAAEARGRRE